MFIARFIAAAVLTQAAELDSKQFVDHVKFLASPEMHGRGTGTPELNKAAKYIARHFKTYGLKPVAGSYIQPFQVTSEAKLGGANKFVWKNGAGKAALVSEQDFVPLNFSSAGRMSGQLVFAGYGITAPEYNYDDYAGLDVKDKIAVVLRREPQEYDEKSVFAGKNYTRHAQFDSKAINAKMHGAKGVIILTDLGAGSALEKFGRTAGPASVGIPFVMLRSDAADKWFTAAGKNLGEIVAEIDKDLKPRSFAFPASMDADVNVDVQRKARMTQNVMGYLPGETDEYVVIGAHYDHLGLGEQFSMAPSMAGTTHPGADDNASGTSGVLELARYFGSRPKQKRGILFLTFAGEELGLLGSSFYVNHPKLPLGKAAAMINMDMIGRIRDGKVYIGGFGTGSTFKATLDELKTESELHFDFSEQIGYGSSDHTSFTTQQVPVLFFFSGLHGDYHKPSDTWDKIDGGEAVKLLTFIAGVTARIEGAPERPQYVRVMPTSPTAPAGSRASGGSTGYGPYFGSIPDFAEPPTGVHFADVRDGSPAAKAGLKAKDIMVGFDGKPVQNLQDFTYLLRSKKPGDEVEVNVLRGNEKLSVKVLLTERK